MDRNNNLFKSYINGQILLAHESFNQQVHGKTIQNHEFSNLNNYGFLPSNFDEDEYEELLQKRILNEVDNAEELYSRIYEIKINH